MKKTSIISILSASVLPFTLIISPASKVNAESTNSNSGMFSYVALGDSLAYGYGAKEGYVPRYSEYLSEKLSKGIELTNLGVNGWTSSDLLNALTSNQNYINSVKNAKFITLDIGGNDLLNSISPLSDPTQSSRYDVQNALQSALKVFTANFPAIVQKVRYLNPSAYLIIMNRYNPYPSMDGMFGTFHNIGNSWLPLFNQVISDCAAKTQNRIEGIADVYDAFEGKQLVLTNIQSQDVHPNDDGYAVMCTELAKVTPTLNFKILSNSR